MMHITRTKAATPDPTPVATIWKITGRALSAWFAAKKDRRPIKCFDKVSGLALWFKGSSIVMLPCDPV